MTNGGHDPIAVESRDQLAAITFWEAAATTRWGRYITRTEERAILQAASLAGKPDQAVEIGCDSGRWAKLLSDSGWQMTCTDINPETLAVCRRKVPAAKCILSNPQDTTIPCESNSANLLLCVEVAPVIQSGWFLTEAGRVLRENGILVGVCWNRASMRGLVWRMKRRLAPNTGTVFYTQSYSDWRKDLGRAGFQLVQAEGLCWSFFGRESNSPLVPLFTKLERLLQLHRLTTWSPWVVFIARKLPPGVRGQAIFTAFCGQQ